MNSLIETHYLQKIYRMGAVEVTALKDINLSITHREFICIAGPSGSGKSTLLNILGSLETPSSGRILFEGADVASFPDDKQAEFRNSTLGFIFQSFNLIPILNVYENIELPLMISNQNCWSDVKNRRKAVLELIERVGLTDHIHHKPFELSGGQQQRVAIARALVNKPKLILADELTANLDSENARKIILLMRELNENLGTTFIFASHDQMVMNLALRLIKLKDGVLVEDTPISDYKSCPAAIQ